MTIKLSRKGQIVIPVELRRRYNIDCGDRVELMDIGGEIVIVPIVVKNPIDGVRGILKGGRTTREILQDARKEERKFERRKKQR